jgi:PAS domain S-box-containing protein
MTEDGSPKDGAPGARACQHEALLHESEERFRLAAASTTDVIYEWNVVTGVIQWFGDVDALLGYGAGELPRTLEALLEHIHPEDRAQVDQATRAGLARRQGWRGEYRVRRKDGALAHWHGTGVAIYDRSGTPVRVIGAISDISEQKRAAEALRHERALYLDLMNAQPAGTYRIRVANPERWRQDAWRNPELPPYHFEHISQRFCELLGLDEERIAAQPGGFFGLVHPEEREEFARLNVEANQRQTPFRWEGRLRLDGRERWVTLDSLPRACEDGDTLWTGILVDVTERRATQEALRQREAQLRALADNLPDGLVYQVDSGPDGTQRRFTHLSAGVEAMHGVTAAEALADPMRIYGQVAEEDQRMVVAREAQAAADLATFRAEVRVRLPSGEERWRLFTSAPRRLPDGRLVWDGIELDITERKAAEEARERLQAQLAQAQKLESVGRLAGGVAHDFNNMLVVILANADLMREQLDPASPLVADLEEIRRAAEHSAELTRQLLAFARKQTIAPRELDLNQSVADALKMLRRLLGEGIELLWRPGAELGPVRMDPAQIDQILTNLCVNARDALGGAGTIAIETTRRVLAGPDAAGFQEAAPGEYAVLRVSDTGCGMEPGTLARLFEPFFTTKVLGRGTGLGLSTVHGIVKQNGGQIRVESAPGKGTTLEVWLPRFSGRARGAATGPAPSVEPGRETVLLVEDEPSILRVGQRMLEALGYTVVAATSPSEAVRLAREHAGDLHLVMTDVVMPEMSGRELAANLQSLYPCLRCLFMSGYSADVLGPQGVLEDGVNFLQKPFSRAELATAVRSALDR